MSNSKKSTSSRLKPGQKAPGSGVYEGVGSHGGIGGRQVATERGKPLPPMPKSAANYTLRAKSGRYIIQSPAQSSNTVTRWSRAFKKK